MSTIALWPGVIASAYGYKSEMASDSKKFWPFLLIGCLGGAAGAFLFLHTPEFVFKQEVPWLMLVATLVFTFGRHGVAAMNRISLPTSVRYTLAFGFQILIAIYGGYFGAGMGILTLAMLQILGHTHIHRMNALKTLFTGSINAITMLIFAFSGKVIWPLAAVMVVGAILGGYVGARTALKIPPHYVRTFVSIIAIAMTSYFFLHGV